MHRTVGDTQRIAKNSNRYSHRSTDGSQSPFFGHVDVVDGVGPKRGVELGGDGVPSRAWQHGLDGGRDLVPGDAKLIGRWGRPGSAI
eukprot:scaffold501620_cov48-Prasinocladus_malaysianus.AAC.4